MSECCSVDLSVRDSRSIDLDVLGESYLVDVPTMSTSVKGGAKVGSGLEVTDATLYVKTGNWLDIGVDNSLNVVPETMTANTAGVAKLGTGLGIASGVLSVNEEIQHGNVRAFDTVADMQAATDLVVGMTCHTNGFHSAGDGGAAFYKVSSTGTANGMDVLALANSLFATLVITESYVTPEMFGAYGDGATNDSAAIQKALCTGLPVHFAGKTYIATEVITKTAPNVIMQGSGTESVIKWGITTTGGLRNYAAMISDDDLENTAYLRSGSVLIENMVFDGNADNITDYPVTNAFGLCAFFARKSYSVKNCTFMNCHADGIHMRGIYGNVSVENCIFKNIGQTQPADGTRNGMTITRNYYDRGAADDVTVTNRIDVTVANCRFSDIADECARVDGVTTFEMNCCTFENIGQHIVESGHLTDQQDYAARISNCTGNNIACGIYTTGADGGGTWTHHGLITIDGCTFEGMCWTACAAAYARDAVAIITNGYQANNNSDYCPDVNIVNTVISSTTAKANLETATNINTLYARNITIDNSNISYVGSGNTGVFIAPTKNLKIIGSTIKLPDTSGREIYIPVSNVRVLIDDSQITTDATSISQMMRVGAASSEIVLNKSIINLTATYIVIYPNATASTTPKIYVDKCIFIGSCSRAIHTEATNEVFNTVYIVGNNIPSNYCSWNSFSNMSANFSVIANNSAYN